LDWESRRYLLVQKLWDRRFREADPKLWDQQVQEVESETRMLLTLPHTILPEPHRTYFRSMNLLAKAGLGACELAHGEVADFETEARRTYPAEEDSSSPPRPRTAAEVRAFRADFAARQKELAAFRRSLEDGSIQKAPDWRDIPADERAKLTKEILEHVQHSLSEAETILKIGNDAVASAEWSRRELAAWEKAHPAAQGRTYDLAGEGERLGIDLRAAVGKCYLEKKAALEAAQVLKPCVGSGKNIHTACAEPLVDAGIQLVSGGNIPAAIAIYRLVGTGYSGARRLFDALEQAAPGTVQRFETSPPPRATPSAN
jgi:hypothetical protein